MVDSKTVSCIANADARRQTPMLSRKWRCRTAKPFPDTATADARQQTPMLSRKRRCRTAKSFPAQKPRMPDGKPQCCLGKTHPGPQKLFPHSNLLLEHA